MAIKYKFDGRDVTEPGSYSRMVSGIPQRISPNSSGKVLIIDTGVGAGWGSNAGVAGLNGSGTNSVYEFADAKSFQNFVSGGVFYDLAGPLFSPSRDVPGAEGVLFIRASATTPATVPFPLAGVPGLVFTTKTEGTTANAIIRGGKLIKGIAVRLRISPRNAAKYILEVFRGSFRGVDNANNQYATYAPASTYNIGDTIQAEGLVFTSKVAANTGNSPLADSLEANWALQRAGVNYLENVTDPTLLAPQLLYTSREFVKPSELIGNLNTDKTAKTIFVPTVAVIGTDSIVPADLTANGVLVPAAGATEIYNRLDDVLEYVGEQDYSFVLSTDNDINSMSLNNDKILDHITNVSEFKRLLFVGGANADADLSAISYAAAGHFANELVTVVHGNCKLSNGANGTRTASSLYLAARVLGRIAGLAPQMPGTWKELGIVGTDSQLRKKDREAGLSNGVLHLRKVNGEFVINQAINTLQSNDQLINSDATSYEISIVRIKQQLIKSLVNESRSIRDADGNRTFIGGNKGTASAEDVKLFVEGFLMRQTVRPGNDNLIISFKNVVITETEDGWNTTFGFVPNGPVNKMFFTGTMLQSAANA